MYKKNAQTSTYRVRVLLLIAFKFILVEQLRERLRGKVVNALVGTLKKKQHMSKEEEEKQHMSI